MGVINIVTTQFLGYLTDLGKILQSYVSGFGSSKSDYTTLIILFFVFAVFMVAFTFGRSRMLVSLVGIYIAYFIERQFVYFSFLKQFLPKVDDVWLHAGIFLLAYILVLAILFGSILKARMSMREASFLPLILISAVEVGFLASIFISFLPSGTVAIPNVLYNLFGIPTAQFLWGILPIVLLLFTRGKKETQKPSVE